MWWISCWTKSRVIWDAHVMEMVQSLFSTIFAWLSKFLYIYVTSIARLMSLAIPQSIVIELFPSDSPRPLCTKKMSPYGCRKTHYKLKPVWRPSQFYNGNPYTSKTVSSYISDGRPWARMLRQDMGWLLLVSSHICVLLLLLALLSVPSPCSITIVSIVVSS